MAAVPKSVLPNRIATGRIYRDVGHAIVTDGNWIAVAEDAFDR